MLWLGLRAQTQGVPISAASDTLISAHGFPIWVFWLGPTIYAVAIIAAAYLQYLGRNSKSAPTAGSVTIHSARYGIGGDAYKDVTDTVRKQVKAGVLNIPASNGLFGDPFPGAVKHLRVVFSTPTMREAKANENMVMSLSGEEIARASAQIWDLKQGLREIKRRWPDCDFVKCPANRRIWSSWVQPEGQTRLGMTISPPPYLEHAIRWHDKFKQHNLMTPPSSDYLNLLDFDGVIALLDEDERQRNGYAV